MKKIYYIIIFILLILLGMVYIQLIDYQKITTSLLEDNKQSINQITELKNNAIILENQSKVFQSQITFLEEKLILQQTEFENNNSFNTNTDNLSLNLEEDLEEKKDTLDPSITPQIDFNEENEVTGFGLEYKQKF